MSQPRDGDSEHRFACCGNRAGLAHCRYGTHKAATCQTAGSDAPRASMKPESIRTNYLFNNVRASDSDDNANHRESSRDRPTKHAATTAVGFLLPFVIFWSVAVCLSLQRIGMSQSSFIRGENADYTCLRATRKNSHVVVHASVGTPFRELDLLLRMDSVFADSQQPIRLYSDTIRPSTSLACQKNDSTCEDVAQFYTNSDLDRPLISKFKFQYENSDSPLAWSSVATQLQLHGELFILRGFRYYIEATRLCVAVVRPTHQYPSDPHLTGTVIGTRVFTTRHATVNLSLAEPRSHGVDCSIDHDTVVALWPDYTASPSTYLSTGTTPISGMQGPVLDARRQIVQDGSQCSSETVPNDAGYHSYMLDCRTRACSRNGSIPFSKVADQAIVVAAAHDSETVMYWLEASEILRHISGVGTDTNKVLFAACKLLLMLLAASVVWVRNSRERDVDTDPCQATAVSKFEDAALGLIAAGARIATVVWRSAALVDEEVWLVVASELVCGTLSILHWMLRHVGLRDPITKEQGCSFGGSAAVLDSSAAVIVAFSEPPLNKPSDGRFDPTARLLTALLISTLGMDICSRATSLCFKRTSQEMRPLVRMAYVFSSIVWLVHCGGLAISVSQTAILPLASGFTRSFSSSQRGATYATACAYISLSVPRILKRI